MDLGVVCDGISQFTYNGESACSFGSLSIASLLLQKDDMKFITPEDLQNSIKQAADNYTMFFDGEPGSHLNAFEILNSELGKIVYPSLKVVRWEDQDKAIELTEILPKLVFPEVFLPIGDLQIQNFLTEEFHALLAGFKGSSKVLCLSTIGYSFGIQCCSDGSFVVFDTHSKTIEKVGKTGAYALKFDRIESAVKFIDEVTLDSRKLMQGIIGSDDLQQSQAVTGLQFCLIEKQN